MKSANRYPRLVKELAVILLIKLAVLIIIKTIWFDAPTLPTGGSEPIVQRLLGTEK
ncbi:MAG TPA: hypothetical protein VJA19_19490 [Pseudomonas sp.]|nr:hypothetical protein [Pseudomonas sp.]